MGRRKHLDFLKEFKHDLSKHPERMGNPKGTAILILLFPLLSEKKTYCIEQSASNYWHLGYPVDFLCYTPEEFKKLSKKITIVREAAEKGIEI